ncbi:hypothetical protein MHY87_13840 [Microvirga sp. ACRRW]|uniref:hypothetical protein n=1 Tax=Microvirga sp. ACRRW TaxID=2918205 RepID=UPI001EF523E1|nr:hypothetical protein [Microvirga sp. ACRRW]MCG7393988.1 hypothetical protein [Microvirga sp. ACRRW]
MVRAHKGKAVVLVALGALWTSSSFAEGTLCLSYGYEDPGRTVNGPIALGRVNNLSARVHFLKNPILKADAACPNMSAACQEKAYLVPGDEVVIIGTKGDFICASYATKQGRVIDSWLPRSAISVVPDLPPVNTKDWIGRWQSGSEQSIVIEQIDKAGVLSIKGDASWGAGDPERVKRGAVHVGSLEGEMKPEGAVLSFGMGENGTLPYDQADEVDCKVQMQRLGPYLLVKDNRMCGGLNVSFTSVYRRVK